MLCSDIRVPFFNEASSLTAVCGGAEHSEVGILPLSVAGYHVPARSPLLNLVIS